VALDRKSTASEENDRRISGVIGRSTPHDLGLGPNVFADGSTFVDSHLRFEPQGSQGQVQPVPLCEFDIASDLASESDGLRIQEHIEPGTIGFLPQPDLYPIFNILDISDGSIGVVNVFEPQCSQGHVPSRPYVCFDLLGYPEERNSLGIETRSTGQGSTLQAPLPLQANEQSARHMSGVESSGSIQIPA
jgi:hypothetical protein